MKKTLIALAVAVVVVFSGTIAAQAKEVCPQEINPLFVLDPVYVD
jgi:hypothetical protein